MHRPSVDGKDDQLLQSLEAPQAVSETPVVASRAQGQGGLAIAAADAKP